MIASTLCYIEQDGKYLMLFRNKKENDPNEGKWIGVGGKLEPGETPRQCLLREVKEETGLELLEYELRGELIFLSDRWEGETMYLYTATEFQGEMLAECAEGELKWVPLSEVLQLNLWEGDRIFLKKLIRGEKQINLTLEYEGDKLVSCRENR